MDNGNLLGVTGIIRASVDAICLMDLYDAMDDEGRPYSMTVARQAAGKWKTEITCRIQDMGHFENLIRRSYEHTCK